MGLTQSPLKTAQKGYRLARTGAQLARTAGLATAAHALTAMRGRGDTGFGSVTSAMQIRQTGVQRGLGLRDALR
jgi:hypothetical protein